jgi:predicted secreted hydrolase
MNRAYCGLVVCVAVTLFVKPTRAQDWEYAQPDFEWQFPRDHWAHSGYKTEWWYFTGQLTDEADSTRKFGYQFTFFRVGITPDSLPINSAWAVTDIVMGHAALTNLTTGEHRFTELVYRANGFLGAFLRADDSLVVWSRAPAGTDGVWKLAWDGSGFLFEARDAHAGFALNLQTRPRKPMVFQGANGYSRKGSGSTAASLYYSFTRLSTRGSVSMDGHDFLVTGETWMDKEFGSNQLTEDQVGWDWFSLRLNDGRDVMLYLLRNRRGEIDFARTTIVPPRGTARFLSGDAWEVNVLDTWRSPETDAEYPVAWRLESEAEGLTLIVTADAKSQENNSRLIPNLFYWEGSVRVTDLEGRFLGRGYVELTGYGTAVPPII